MTKLVGLLAVAAMLLSGALPSSAAELLTKPRVSGESKVRYGYGYPPFVGWRPTFEFTAGYRGYHAEPYFLGPVPACGYVRVPYWRHGEMYFRYAHRCW